MLNWDETEVLAVLEVLPEEESYGVWHRYIVEKDGIKLSVTIHQYDGDIEFELFNMAINKSLFSMRLIDCSAIQRKKDSTGEYLEFAPSKCFGSRYDVDSSVAFGIRVSVYPSIHISLFG